MLFFGALCKILQLSVLSPENPLEFCKQHFQKIFDKKYKILQLTVNAIINAQALIRNPAGYKGGWAIKTI